MRDTKRELLVKGHALALKHGLGYLTSKTMQEATGFYKFAVKQHYGSVAAFREEVKAHGIAKGTMTADTEVRCPRMAPAERKVQILDEAYRQAEVNGLALVTLTSVASALTITGGLISRYFGTLVGFREAVLAKAVVAKQPDIVADAIELGMNVHHVPEALVKKAQRLLAAA